MPRTTAVPRSAAKPGGQFAAKPLNHDELIRSVFLRTVGHPPDSNENKEAHELFASAKTPVDGAKRCFGRWSIRKSLL